MTVSVMNPSQITTETVVPLAKPPSAAVQLKYPSLLGALGKATLHPVRRLLANDVTKLLAFLALTFALAAVLVPHVYNIGQFLAEVTRNKSINGFIDSIGQRARQANYAYFFNRSLYLAALLLLPLLLFTLKARKTARTPQGPWSFALPPRAIASKRGQGLVQPKHWLQQLLGGFALGSIFLLSAGALAVLLGLFTGQTSEAFPSVSQVLATALLIALLEEFIFRGVILGIFLRTFRSGWAIFWVALLFAGLHLILPSEGIAVTEPEDRWAGFTFLQTTTLRLFDQQLLLQQFCPLFFAGILLGVARYLTSSLWLPIGLHAGWQFALVLFGKITEANPAQAKWMSPLIGENLSQGLLPLASVGISALIIWVVYREPDYQPSASKHPDSPLDPATF